MTLSNCSIAELSPSSVDEMILAVEGEPVRRPRDLIRRVRAASEGSQLAFEIARRGKVKQVVVALRGAPWPPRFDYRPWLPDSVRDLRGAVREIERRLRELEELIRSQAAGSARQT